MSRRARSPTRPVPGSGRWCGRTSSTETGSTPPSGPCRRATAVISGSAGGATASVSGTRPRTRSWRTASSPSPPDGRPPGACRTRPRACGRPERETGPTRGSRHEPASRKAGACGRRSGCCPPTRRTEVGPPAARSTSWSSSATSRPPCTEPCTTGEPGRTTVPRGRPTPCRPAASPTSSTCSPSNGRKASSVGSWMGRRTRRRRAGARRALRFRRPSTSASTCS